MRTAMATKTKAMLAIGFLVFVVGTAGAAYLGSRGSGSASQSGAGSVQVLYAARSVAVGTAASTALADGSIRTKAVSSGSRPADAVIDASQLSGRVANDAIAAGTVVTTGMFPAPQTRIGTVVVPPGKRALAVQLAPVPGIAGFAGAGDQIDVYSVSKGADGGPTGVRLILQGVGVLNVNGAGLPSAQGQADGTPLVYLLAVTPPEAERLIYLTEFDALYFDLIPKGEPPVATPGAGPTQALAAL